MSLASEKDDDDDALSASDIQAAVLPFTCCGAAAGSAAVKGSGREDEDSEGASEAGCANEAEVDSLGKVMQLFPPALQDAIGYFLVSREHPADASDDGATSVGDNDLEGDALVTNWDQLTVQQRLALCAGLGGDLMEVAADHGRHVELRFTNGSVSGRDVQLQLKLNIREAVRHLSTLHAAASHGSSFERERQPDLIGAYQPDLIGASPGTDQKRALPDPFSFDNRMGIDGSLHRISAIRDRDRSIIGLTYRIGRHIPGQLGRADGYSSFCF